MSIINTFIQIFLHLDKNINFIVSNYGSWTYLIIFIIIFCETGLVVTPFLPGDSLVFAIGAVAALGAIKMPVIFILLCMAAIAGDTLNYHIGYIIGPQIFEREKIKFLKKEYLYKTQSFYERHGRKTIIIARFVPIVRTFAPFVAGIGKMSYKRFISYNIVGGISWVSLFLFVGYFFGNLPIIKVHFTLIVYLIILISIMPGIIEFIRQKYFVNKTCLHMTDQEESGDNFD